MDAAHKQTMRLLRTASLERPSLSAEVIKSTTHEVFLAAIQGLERKANWASNALQEAPSADSTLTLAEVQAICRQHELLCAPVHICRGCAAGCRSCAASRRSVRRMSRTCRARR